MATYKILRFSRNRAGGKTIKRGLTLEEAQEHCSHSWTQKKDKNGCVVWFDGYTKECE